MVAVQVVVFIAQIVILLHQLFSTDDLDLVHVENICFHNHRPSTCGSHLGGWLCKF